MTVDIKKNEDGTYQLEFDYRLWSNNASLGEVIGAIVDQLKDEDNA